MTGRYWFKPKRYGYGATPATWEGWLFTAASVAVLAGSFCVLSGRGPLTMAETVGWWIVLIVALVGIWVITWAKTEGDWRWRWGEPK